MLFHSILRETQSLQFSNQVQLFFIEVENEDLTEDGSGVQYQEDIVVPLNFTTDEHLKKALVGTINKIREDPKKMDVVEIYVFLAKEKAGFYGKPAKMSAYMSEHIDEAIKIVRSNFGVNDESVSIN